MQLKSLAPIRIRVRRGRSGIWDIALSYKVPAHRAYRSLAVFGRERLSLIRRCPSSKNPAIKVMWPRRVYFTSAQPLSGAPRVPQSKRRTPLRVSRVGSLAADLALAPTLLRKHQ